MAGHFDGTYSTRCEASLVEWTETQCSGPRCHACRPAVGRSDWELSLAPVERDWRMRPVVQAVEVLFPFTKAQAKTYSLSSVSFGHRVWITLPLKRFRPGCYRPSPTTDRHPRVRRSPS